GKLFCVKKITTFCNVGIYNMTYFQAPWLNHIIFHCSSITLKRRDIIVESRYVPVACRYILSYKWSVAKNLL
ncbi:MAG: hypothetical protein WBP84_03860, partial [Nitrososphaeraceae archaeon]